MYDKIYTAIKSAESDELKFNFIKIGILLKMYSSVFILSIEHYYFKDKTQ